MGYDVLRCANYIEGATLLTCSSCIEGYSLDISGKSCICDTGAGFKEFTASPIKCGYEIFRCISYIEGPSLYTCSQCQEGYTLEVSSKSCVCDTNAGYKQFIVSPIKCGYDVLRCANYIEGATLFTCSSCIEGYSLDNSGKSCACDTNS